MTRSIRRSLLTAAILGLTAASSQAAPIIWGAPQNITGDSDVSLDGSLIRAFNVGDTGVAATTVNTVNFESFAVPSGSAGATVGNFAITTAPAGSSNTAFAVPPFSTLSSEYRTLLAAGLLQGFGFTLTISGLSVGTPYEFQWWANNSNTPSQFQATATAGNTVTLLTNVQSAVGGVGQFALGDFTADAATQTISFGGQIAHLNGFQLRQVPEPSTGAMLAAGAGSLLGFRRRRA